MASPAPVAPAAAPMDAGERVRLLKDLAELHAAGVLTDAEFSAQKAALLAG
ncbi:SHOCT domain-containing protein [Propionibacterium sp.]|uniref:SHOCT domain-containing protein n=1 Tax=Propionibacterium sp. TaxID=1977903 RepID=UPI0039E8067A